MCKTYRKYEDVPLFSTGRAFDVLEYNETEEAKGASDYLVSSYVDFLEFNIKALRDNISSERLTSLSEFSPAELCHYAKYHLCFTGSYSSVNGYAPVMMFVQLASDVFWQTGIASMQDMGLASSQVANITLIAVSDEVTDANALTEMLWHVESEIKDAKKEYIVAKVNPSNYKAMNALFAAGYIIRSIDETSQGSAYVFYKNLSWSKGINYRLHLDDAEEQIVKCYKEEKKEEVLEVVQSHKSFLESCMKKEDTGVLTQNIKLNKFDEELVPCNVIDNNLNTVIKAGYYPTAIKNGYFVCCQITGLSSENVLAFRRETHAA